MTKQQLLDASTSIKTNLTLAWTLLPLLDSKEYYELIEDLASKNHNIPPLLNNLRTHKDQMKYYYFTTELLNAIREYCEIIKEYCCQNTGSYNYNRFYEDDTMTFARYIRNCITHEFKFSFKSSKDRQRVTNNPPKWRGKTIDIALDGKQFDKTFMTHQDVVDLLNDLDSTIKTFR